MNYQKTGVDDDGDQDDDDDDKKCSPKWKKMVQKTGNGQFCSGNFYTEQF